MCTPQRWPSLFWNSFSPCWTFPHLLSFPSSHEYWVHFGLTYHLRKQSDKLALPKVNYPFQWPLNFNWGTSWEKNKFVSKVELAAEGSRRFFNRSWNKLDLWITSTQQFKPIYSQGFPYKSNYGLTTISEVPLFIVLYSMSEFHLTRDLTSDAWLILQWLLTLFSNLLVTEGEIRAFRTTLSNHLYKWLEFSLSPWVFLSNS